MIKDEAGGILLVKRQNYLQKYDFFSCKNARNSYINQVKSNPNLCQKEFFEIHYT